MTGRPDGCICLHFSDTGGHRIGDLACPVHVVGASQPLDGPWETGRPGNVPAASKPAPASDHIPVSPPDLHRLVSLALAVTEDDAGFVEAMRALAEAGP